MKLYTLGTSHGNHTPGRFCSSTLLAIGERLYLIDAGEPASAQVFRAGLDFNNIKAVFVTHMHDDHTSGLTALSKAICKYPTENTSADFYFPEAEAIEPFEKWVAATHIDRFPKYIQNHVVTEGMFYDDGVLRAFAIPTKHMTGGEPSFAFLVEAEGKRLLFTGDLAPDFSDFPHVDGHIDVCVSEATHYKPEIALPTLQKQDFGKLIFNHLHELYIGDGEDVFLQNYVSLPYLTMVAHDLEIFAV